MRADPVPTAAGVTPGLRPRTLSVEEVWRFAEAQVRRLVHEAPGRFPTYTRRGRWVTDTDPWAPSWTGGFLAGICWLLSHHSSDPDWWQDKARRYCGALEARKNDESTHDLGFILEPSWGRWHDWDPSPRTRDVLAAGGRTMALRLQPAGGYLRSWVDPGSTFVDIMMNVGLVFRAAEYSGDGALFEVALRHCETSRRYLVRGDGSTVHEGWFETVTGEYLRAATHQGWRSDSSWARGQAWAIYGFDTAFRHSGDGRFCATARAVADYYMENTPASGIPPNDWAEPDPWLDREASAAAIAAAGMLRLAASLDGVGHGAAPRYRDYALGILATLRSTEYTAADSPGWDGILRHATYHQRRGLGVDESVMFGDHYFLEALDLAGETGGVERSAH